MTQPSTVDSLRPGSPGDTVLEVTDLTVDFPTDDGIVHAVRGVSYTIGRGETVSIVGESGSGKSVTSLAIMGLLPRSARIGGSARLHGREILNLPDNEMRDIRGKQVAMIFQDPMTSLNPVYTVGWQVAEALRAHDGSLSKSAARDRSIELLKLVDIPNAERRVDQYPHEFSGGMRQRAVIAIGIANNPEVIIADEPTTALDVTIQAQVLETLKKAQQETGAALVLITHDLGVVAGVADRVLVMYAGRPVELGSVEDIYYAPRMPYTVGLLGSLPRLDSRTQERLTPIQGAPPSLINLPPGCPFGPRCPLHQARCDEEEPPMEAVAGMTHLAACWYSEVLSAQGIEASDIFAATGVDAEVPLAGTALGGEEANIEALGAAAAAAKIAGRAAKRAAAKATKSTPRKTTPKAGSSEDVAP